MAFLPKLKGRSETSTIDPVLRTVSSFLDSGHVAIGIDVTGTGAVS